MYVYEEPDEVPVETDDTVTVLVVAEPRASVTTTTCVALCAPMDATGTPHNDTAVMSEPLPRPVPTMVTCVPPTSLPLLG